MDINQFRDWIGIDTDIDEITSAKVQGYYEHLLGSLAGPDDVLTSTYSVRGKIQIFKQFVRWLGENEYITALPVNLGSHQMVIEVDCHHAVDYDNTLDEALTFLRDKLLGVARREW